MSILDHFQHLKLTPDQEGALSELEYFLTEADNRVFLMKGYAGTGKTTLVKGLVEYIHKLGFPYHLMAPTGRAAKVLSERTGQRAHTIHKSIYNFSDLEEIKVKDKDQEVSYKYYFKLHDAQNLSTDIFLVDEASMISDRYSEHEFFMFGSGFLLKDLLTYTKVHSRSNRVKIIFIGDNAQLPPIGMNLSPALEETYLSKHYKLQPYSYELEDVVRQDAQNGILRSARIIRDGMYHKIFNHFDVSADNQSIYQIKPEQLIERFQEKMNRSIIIVYKNRTAMAWNKAIHDNQFPETEHICHNDTIIVGRNNYHHEILNGDFGVVINASPGIDEKRTIPVYHEGEKHQVELKWRYIELLFKTAEKEEKVVKGYMLENFLHAEEPTLSVVEQKALYIDFKIRYPKLKPGSEDFKDTLKEDQFFNAIMLKYGYAVTCHKAQGGEWERAFVIWDYKIQKDIDAYNGQQPIKGRTNEGFYRWAYTAITRAEKELYNINPPYFDPTHQLDFVPSVALDQLDEIHGTRKDVVRITWSARQDQLIESLGLNDMAWFQQNKSVEIDHLLSQRYIQIARRQGKPYQEVYTFKRGEQKAKVIFFYNGKNEFTRMQLVPSGTNSEDFYKEIYETLNQNVEVEILKEADYDTKVNNFGYIPNFPDGKPWLQHFYNQLAPLCREKNIRIKNLEHHNYRERYVFEQNGGQATLDFVYNGKGFFTRVEERQHTSADLIIELNEIIQSIKKKPYVV
jgi:hypothetical protein